VRRNTVPRAVLLPLLFLLAGCWTYITPGGVETGVHWAAPEDYPELQRLGYDFVIAEVTGNRADWVRTFDAAEASGLELIVGVYPPPFRLRQGHWTITPRGKEFLRYAASRAQLVKAIFVFNEPYWIDPADEHSDACGAVSAADLRKLRSLIRGVWPEALIYQDIGDPSRWAPGGEYAREYDCLGDKYADQTGVADFVGIWDYPFDRRGYRRREALSALRREAEFVRTRMEAEPIILAQSFGCKGCSPATTMPPADGLRDWNCAVRSLKPYAVSWYVWRQDSYDDYLSKHPDAWATTTAAACADKVAGAGE